MKKHFGRIHPRTTHSLCARFCAGLALAAALIAPAASVAKEKTLYERLGGKKAITAVVDEFVSRVAMDNRINHFFAQTATDPARLSSFKMKLVDQICMASGGPCKYTGKDMKSAHAGMGVTAMDFNALVEDLTGALDKFKVGDKEKNDLLGADAVGYRYEVKTAEAV